MDWILHALDLHRFVPADLLVVAVLVVLEGLLSCDNAVVLALLVKDLSPDQRGKALRYGIIGAYVFRIAALFLAVWIMTVWQVKVLGGAYLCWLAIEFFRHGDQGKKAETRRILGLSIFWSTVVNVEFTDIIFSVDSIAAAVALSKKMWVLILGGLLGILAMRFAAQAFITLIERFPRLTASAFAAVAVIGVKLLLEFPVDVIGSQRPLPPEAIYATAAQWSEQADRHVPSAVHVPHVLSVNLVAPPPPEEQRFSDPGEYKEARANWALHHRPFLEVEGWVSSIVVLAIFAFGFRQRRRATP